MKIKDHDLINQIQALDWPDAMLYASGMQLAATLAKQGYAAEALKIRDLIDASKLKLTPKHDERLLRLQLIKNGCLDTYKAKLLKE